MSSQASWRPVALDSSLLRSPRATIPAPVMGKLETLPFDLLSWEDFERIQWRIMRDVEGLRNAQIYGDRGQSQYGLDVVALAPDRSGVALQSKRYKRFGPAELRAAVKVFRRTSRPFAVNRLIIGVSREIKSTKVVETLAELRQEIEPVALDFWDSQKLSGLLRGAPEIVIEFFGMPTAEAFCLPFTLEPVLVPSADAVAIREALARTPEETTGAAQLLREAGEASGDPLRALLLIESAQVKLRDAGFKGYAAQHEPTRSRLLAELGRADEAARQILDDLWAALDQGVTTTAMRAQHRLGELSRDMTELGRVGELLKVADSAIDLYLNPLAYVPEPGSLVVGDLADQVRLAVLAGETALSNDDSDWLVRGHSTLVPLVEAAAGDRVFRTRLRLLVAEGADDWTEILEDVRKLRLGHDLLGLVTARYARYCALNQRFAEADALWDEAAGDACLAQRWSEASTWVFSRRAFRSRWNPFTSDELLPLQTALREMGPSRPIMTVDTDAHVGALEGLRGGKLRTAAIAAQRALRDAVATSDWVAEGAARQVLGEILSESNEPELAARHFTRAGDTTAIKELGGTYNERFIDISGDLAAVNYWTVGTAYRLIAKQSDLVPDELVGRIADYITGELTGQEAGQLADLRSFATSRYGGALSALAGIAHRLTSDTAAMVLAHFERQPSVEPNHYRYHDEDEATAVARIALSQPSLRQPAIDHLVTLLARSQTARNHTTKQAIDRHIEVARAGLKEHAEGGNDWAQEVLALDNPDETQSEVVEDALKRLTTSLIHQPGVFPVGTGAVRDSVLVRGLPSARLELAVAELLRRANDPHVGSSDRNDYLIAASNLAHKLDQADRNKHFPVALNCASSPISSDHDEFEQQFSHKLGVLRITQPDGDSRDTAVFLAACLATDDAQRADVKTQAYAQLGTGQESGYWLTRALQRLGDALNEDLGFLAGQGWALRSLAGILWAGHGAPTQVGARLAGDADVRVRRALADALSRSDVRAFQTYVRERLAHDPCYSVREALIGDDAS